MNICMMSKIFQHILIYYSHLGSVSPTFTQMLKSSLDTNIFMVSILSKTTEK